MSSDPVLFLEQNGIMPTPVRILVFKCLENASSPLSLTDIETIIESVDKSTVSRTLTTFKEHHIVHSFNDGSGSVKYELCKSPHNYDEDLHVHFRCEKCGKTLCLSSIKIPDVILPPGFEMHSSNFVISGICDLCNQSAPSHP